MQGAQNLTIIEQFVNTAVRTTMHSSELNNYKSTKW